MGRPAAIRIKLSNHPEYDQQDEGHDDRYGNGAKDPETAREEHEHLGPSLCAKRADRGGQAAELAAMLAALVDDRRLIRLQ
jgi:hypothetical protein